MICKKLNNFFEFFLGFVYTSPNDQDNPAGMVPRSVDFILDPNAIPAQVHPLVRPALLVVVTSCNSLLLPRVQLTKHSSQLRDTGREFTKAPLEV